MDDLISRFRDYQIEWLTSHNDIEFCEEEEKLIIGFLKDTAESFMRENQSAQQWIPCSKMLPMDKGTYLVTDDSGRVAWVEKSWFMWCADGSPFWEYANVTAWMPLPEPYKG